MSVPAFHKDTEGESFKRLFIDIYFYFEDVYRCLYISVMCIAVCVCMSQLLLVYLDATSSIDCLAIQLIQKYNTKKNYGRLKNLYYNLILNVFEEIVQYISKKSLICYGLLVLVNSSIC